MHVYTNTWNDNITILQWPKGPLHLSFSPPAKARLVLFTRTPSRGCQGWCGQGNLQSPQTSSPIEQRSPGDPSTGINKNIFLTVVLCWHIIVYTGPGCTWQTWSRRCTTLCGWSWPLILSLEEILWLLLRRTSMSWQRWSCTHYVKIKLYSLF